VSRGKLTSFFNFILNIVRFPCLTL